MLKLYIKNPLDKTVDFEVSVPDDALVDDLRAKVGSELSVDPSLVRLIYSGTMLVGSKPLSHFNISNDSVIHISVKKAKLTVPSTDVAAQPAQPPSAEQIAQQAPPRAQPQLPPTPSGLFSGANMDSMDSIFSLLSGNPIVRSLLSNKDFVRQHILNSPMMQEMVQSNPELAAHMQSPEAIEMLTELMGNPDKLQAALRDVDSSITQMSTTPGGAAMLERLRHDMNRLQANLQSMERPPVDLFGLNGSQDSSEPTEEQRADSLRAYEYLQNLFNSENNSLFTNLFGPTAQDGMIPVMFGKPSSRFSEPGFPMTYSQMIQNEIVEDSFFIPTVEAKHSASAFPNVQNGGLDPGSIGGMSPDSLMNVIRSNPIMMEMVREMSRNPELIRQQLSNPMFQNMMRQQLGNSPYVSELLNNPDLLANILNRYLNNMDSSTAGRQMNQQYMHQQGNSITTTLDQLRQRFTKELDEVHAMGIYDKDDEVLQLLSQYGGNLEYVLNILFQ